MKRMRGQAIIEYTMLIGSVLTLVLLVSIFLGGQLHTVYADTLSQIGIAVDDPGIGGGDPGPTPPPGPFAVTLTRVGGWLTPEGDLALSWGLQASGGAEPYHMTGSFGPPFGPFSDDNLGTSVDTRGFGLNCSDGVNEAIISFTVTDVNGDSQTVTDSYTGPCGVVPVWRSE